ncbi:carboxymuconolactone decarboxylase family protein [Bordetella sp. N]|uniref:carboxymuconolactone decarboxylase family protein n=1 Tax=Bordetella sp. N TaxID=1746199 RepID=UPI0007102A02|nr:carboxymuconolactone decarboxylase family protein [Bordetella sp. N]ALM84580.1 hypothetical protein ASB57_17775 [Bordetella sp. N]
MTTPKSSDNGSISTAVPAKTTDRRFAWKTPDDLPADQRQAYDGILARRGKVPEPYRALLASPDLAGQFEQLAANMWKSGLAAEIIESIYLSVASWQQCAYQWQAHFPKALEAGVTEEQVRQILARQALVPDSPLAAAIAFTEELQRDRHVSNATYERVTQHFGDKGRANLLLAVSVATSIALLLNVQHVDG